MAAAAEQPQPMLDAPASPATQAAAAAAPPVDPEAARRRIHNATVFLRNPQVRQSPLARRVNFLKSKGLSVEEIMEAFAAVGQPQTKQAIDDIISGKTAPIAAPAPPPVALTTTSTPQPNGVPQIVYQQAPASHPQYIQAPPHVMQPAFQPQLHPQSPPASLLTSLSWKDYFIGATAAAVGMYGAVRLFNAFSPWHIVPKNQEGAAVAPYASGIGAQAAFSQDDSSAIGPTGSNATRRKSRSSRRKHTSSEGEADIVRQQSSMAYPPPVPPTPVKLDVEAEKKMSELNKKIEEMNSELTTAKEAIEKERKERADLAVANGKLRGQITSLNRTVERTTQAHTKAKEDLAEALQKITPTASPLGNGEGANSTTPVVGAEKKEPDVPAPVGDEEKADEPKVDPPTSAAQ